MRAKKTLLTAEKLFRLSLTGHRYDLVKGELFEMPPAGGRHGDVAMEIGARLRIYVRDNGLGRAFAAKTGFILRRDPDTVRAPDASFVAIDRLPSGEPPIGYIDVVPDLAVEVVSLGDTNREVEEKVLDWLRSGVKLVWVIYPANRSATVYRSMDDEQDLSEDDSLDGEQVVPGFTCSVGDLFL